MFDIKGTTDLELDNKGDLIIETTPNSLFKKALLTPKGYISYEYQPNNSIDTDYGNNVYYKIRENIDTSVIATLNEDVKDAASYVDVPTKNIQASIDSLATINYVITYTDTSTQEITINV